MSDKICQCAEGPKLTQAIPSGFSGFVTCAKCEGRAQYPRPEKKYAGSHPVEEYLFGVQKNTTGLTFETAVLTMLLRIEKALQNRGNR